ncbi:MAG: asparagine synthase-related protein [Candidatus Aenigmatarchaeota archaeon]
MDSFLFLNKGDSSSLLKNLEEGNRPNNTYSNSEISLMTSSEIITNDNNSVLTIVGDLYNNYGNMTGLLNKLEENINSIKELDGDFIGFLHNTKTGKNVIFRDKTGTYPIYYSKKDSHLMVGIKIKNILKHPEVKGKINSHSVKQDIKNDSVKLPNTILEEIYRVMPGNCLIISNDEINKKTIFNHERRMETFDSEIRNKLSEALKKSINKRFEGNTALLYSGGFDSTVLAVEMKKLNKPIKTYTFADSEGHVDVTMAKKTSEEVGFENEIKIYEEEEIIDGLPKGIFNFEGMKPVFNPTFNEINEENLISGQGECVSFLAKKFSFSEKLKNFRCIDKIARGVEKSIRYPYLSKDLVDLSKNIKKYEDQNILRKIYEKEIPERINKRRKFGANQAFSNSLDKMKEMSNKMISDEYKKSHEYGKIVRSKFQILLFDVFKEIFIENNCKIPKNFLINDLY